MEEEKGFATTLIGLAACMVSSFSFGSMFVAVRKYPAGDGIFVQVPITLKLKIQLG